MSTDDRKTLLPEFLPAPGPGDGRTPPERVAERARVLLQRFRLSATAGAAVLSVQCGGYAVVDSLPPPAMQCTTSTNPFPSLMARGWNGPADGGLAQVIVEVSSAYYPAFTGIGIAAVRVTGGTLVNVHDTTPLAMYGGSRFEVTITPDDATSDILVDIDLTCASLAATKHYRVSRTGSGPNAYLTVTEIAGAVDGGPVDGGPIDGAADAPTD